MYLREPVSFLLDQACDVARQQEGSHGGHQGLSLNCPDAAVKTAPGRPRACTGGAPVQPRADVS